MRIVIGLSSLKTSLYTLIVNELKRGESDTTLAEMIWCCWEYYASISDHRLVNHLTIDWIIRCYLVGLPDTLIEKVIRVILRDWDAIFSRVTGQITDYMVQGDTLIVTVSPMEYYNASGY